MGRSGSTLLDRTLDQLPGVCSVGETTYIWDRGLRDNVLCACGETFRNCTFWAEVGRVGFGGWETFEVERVLKLQHRVQRNRYIPAFLLPSAAPAFQREQATYAEYVGRLYSAIAKVAGADVVVDGTKIPAGAYMAWRTPGVTLLLLHLVRDPRAVAYSWTKKVRRPEVVDEDAYLPIYTAQKTSLRYDFYHAAYELLSRRGVPTMRLRYEDFVADPPGNVRRLAEFAGLSPTASDLAFVQADSVELGIGHSPSGNPMRFHRGRLPVHLDDAWRSKYPIAPRRSVSILTAPLRLRYGYVSFHKGSGCRPREEAIDLIGGAVGIPRRRRPAMPVGHRLPGPAPSAAVNNVGLEQNGNFEDATATSWTGRATRP
jgi:hypothetical protein